MNKLKYKFATLGQKLFGAKINTKTREEIIKLAEKIRELKVMPIEGYIVQRKEGNFFVTLGNRPPKVFDSNNKPLDMDLVFRIGN